MWDDLDGIRKSLLHRLRVSVTNGDESFERHVLLAVRFHSASMLNQTGKGEGAGWGQFFEEHFPKRPEWRPEDADALWDDWRVGLVKGEAPLSRISVTHGQPQAHWWREPGGTLCINLESMWDDFEASVGSFLRLLERDDVRRAEAVRRWRGRRWTVRQLQGVPPGSSLSGSTASAAAPLSVTGIAPYRDPRAAE